MSRAKSPVSFPVKAGSVLHRLLCLLARQITNGPEHNLNFDTSRKVPKGRASHHRKDRDKPQ